MPNTNRIKWKSLTVVTVLSGIIYNSWPVGYWLNPYIARHDLASELEALHEPFRWLFVAGDVVSSILLIFAAVVLLISVRRLSRSNLMVVALANAIAFAVGTIFDALVPLQCDPSVQRCMPYLHDPNLLIHGLFSILASVCLFVTMTIFWWLDKRSRLMRGIVVGYILFGVFSIVSIILPGQDSWAQHYSLLLDGVCIAIIPFIISELIRKQKLREGPTDR